MGDILIRRRSSVEAARSMGENGRIFVSGLHCPAPEHSSPTSRRRMMTTRGGSKAASSQSLKSWWNDPERKRQRRISSYKYYTTEANVRNTFKKGLRWLGKKCSLIIRRF